MRAQRQAEVSGTLSRRRPAIVADDGLYRYVPVPPVYRDAEGYPIEDGMSQSNKHLQQTTLWYHALTLRLPTATVGSDLPMPYRQGDTTRVLVPDLFVARQAPPQENRLSYRLWENPVPELVIEMLSESTSEADIGSKRRTYEHLGVNEYWLFDPEGFELATPLEGYRLRDGRYRPIVADSVGRLHSEVLGLHLHVRDDQLRFLDPGTGEDLTTYVEAEGGRLAEKQRADAQQQRADAEKDRADAAEERAKAAERELAHLRLRLDEP